MAYTTNIPVIGEITISPEIIAINQTITIRVAVSEVSAQVDYVYPYAGEVNSPWP